MEPGTPISIYTQQKNRVKIQNFSIEIEIKIQTIEY